ncbi:MAG: hypothetical protein Q9179_005050 [Wetmoreana sp. 5 TL-2023]
MNQKTGSQEIKRRRTALKRLARLKHDIGKKRAQHSPEDSDAAYTIYNPANKMKRGSEDQYAAYTIYEPAAKEKRTADDADGAYTIYRREKEKMAK